MGSKTEMTPRGTARRINRLINWPRQFRLSVSALVLLGALLATACEGASAPKKLSNTAKEMWEQGSYRDSARNFIALTELYPSHSLAEESLYWAANIYAQYLQDAALATRYFRQLLDQFPNGEYRVDSREGLALVYESAPDTRKRALQLYRQLLKRPSAKARYHFYQFKLASLNLQAGAMDQARYEFRKMITEYPDSPYLPETYYLIGYSYYLEERYPLALAIFDHADRKFPKSEFAQRARFFIADTLEEQGHVKEALREFQSLKGRYHSTEILARRIKALKSRLRRSVR